MLNRSQKAGCIGQSPASHLCHARSVTCTSVAACVWVSPQASRAALISAGEGLRPREGARLRWGWLAKINPALLAKVNDAERATRGALLDLNTLNNNRRGRTFNWAALGIIG